ncbi:MAG: tRNA lysidine(34) synthetase TilS [Chloroflexi bacterium]|nr:tRNA lysidine(34) synthetase TilS [Chloroflexota bacterium]
MSTAKRLPQQVAQLVDALGLFVPGERLLVGVSGGADSLCLLHVLRELAPPRGLVLAVAHLNHLIRGQSAAADAAFVAELCQQWDIPCTLGEADVPAIARCTRRSLEEAARQERYRFLAQTAAACGAGTICVGHHADDQAETVLMHLLRGAGLDGLRGMRVVEPVPGAPQLCLVRLLLQTTRQEIEAYCCAHGLEPRIDETSSDLNLLRNRLRHELIPTLEHYNPQLRARLVRTAEVLQGDAALLEEVVQAAWDAVIIEDATEQVVFARAHFLAQSRALQRALLRCAITQLSRNLRDISFNSIESALNMLNKGVTGSLADLPGGLFVQLGYTEIVLEHSNRAACTPAWPAMTHQLPLTLALPGELINQADGWRFSAELTEPQTGLQLATADPFTIVLDAERLGYELTVGTRAEGDRMQPLGMGGRSVKLHDMMINCKVPADQRPFVPVVRCGAELVWVVGLRQDERYAIKPRTRQAMLLRLHRLVG